MDFFLASGVIRGYMAQSTPCIHFAFQSLWDSLAFPISSLFYKKMYSIFLPTTATKPSYG